MSTGSDRGSSATTRPRESHEDDNAENEEGQEEDQQRETNESELESVGTADRASVPWAPRAEEWVGAEARAKREPAVMSVCVYVCGGGGRVGGTLVFAWMSA